jgi:hypothetical protein
MQPKPKFGVKATEDGMKKKKVKKEDAMKKACVKKLVLKLTSGFGMTFLWVYHISSNDILSNDISSNSSSSNFEKTQFVKPQFVELSNVEPNRTLI